MMIMMIDDNQDTSINYIIIIDIIIRIHSTILLLQSSIDLTLMHHIMNHYVVTTTPFQISSR